MKQALKFIVIVFAIICSLLISSNNVDFCKNALLGVGESLDFVKFDQCKYKNGIQPTSFSVKNSKDGTYINCSCDVQHLCNMFRANNCELHDDTFDTFVIPNLLKPTRNNPEGNITCPCSQPVVVPVASPVQINVDTSNSQTQLRM